MGLPGESNPYATGQRREDQLMINSLIEKVKTLEKELRVLKNENKKLKQKNQKLLQKK